MPATAPASPPTATRPYKGVQPTYFLYNPYSERKVDLPQGRIIDQAPSWPPAGL